VSCRCRRSTDDGSGCPGQASNCFFDLRPKACGEGADGDEGKDRKDMVEILAMRQ
jgi:hypothetical protein